MGTISDLVISALVLLNETAPGETPAADELIDGISRANDLLSSWDTDEFRVFVIKQYTQALTAAQASYTIGAGGDLDTTRPVKIESCGMIVGGHRADVKPMNSVQYAAKKDKAAAAVVAEEFYIDGDYPLSTIYFWPVPSGTPTLELFMWGSFEQFTVRKYTDLVVNGTDANKVTSAAYAFASADVNNYLNVTAGAGFTPGRYQITAVNAGVATLSANVGTVSSTGGVAAYDEAADFPPGYFKAIRYNLAVDLAPEYGRQVDEAIATVAANSLAQLRALNASNAAATEQPPAPQVQAAAQ